MGRITESSVQGRRIRLAVGLSTGFHTRGVTANVARAPFGTLRFLFPLELSLSLSSPGERSRSRKGLASLELNRGKRANPTLQRAEHSCTVLQCRSQLDVGHAVQRGTQIGPRSSSALRGGTSTATAGCVQSEPGGVRSVIAQSDCVAAVEFTDVDTGVRLTSCAR